MTDRTPKQVSIQRLAKRLHARVGLTRYSAVEFLVVLVSLLLVTPLIQGLSHAVLIEGILLTLVLGSAVLVVGGDRRTLMIAVALSVPAVLAKWMHHFLPDVVPTAVFPVAAVAFVGFVVFKLLQFILKASQVDAEVLCAGIATYLTLGLLWTFAYLLVSSLTPHAFSLTGVSDKYVMNGFDALYFSYVTLSTVGFGDITPVSPTARMLAVLESLSGTIYLAVLVARLVSMYSVTTNQRPPDSPPTE